MKRAINVKAVVILVVTLVAVGASAHFLHGYQVRRNVGDLLERASEAEAEGDPAKAAEWLSYYLGMKPLDTDVLARYGLLLRKLAPSPRAQFHALMIMEQALRADPDRSDLRLEIARTSLELGRVADAQEYLEILQKTSPDNPELERMRGRCEVGLSRHDKALPWFTRAIRHAPDDVSGYALLWRLQLNDLNQPENADEVIKDLLGTIPRSVVAQLEGAQYYRQRGFLDEAEKHIAIALNDLAADGAGAFAIGAEVADARNDQETCRARLEHGLRLHPEDSGLNLAMARLGLRKGQRAPALVLLQRVLEALPEQPAELFHLGELLVEAGSLDKAEEVIRRVREKGHVGVAEHLQAALLMQRGEWGQARQILEDNLSAIRGSQWTKRANLMLARCYEQLANPDGQLAAYGRALQVDALWPPALAGRAAVLARQGKIDDAIRNYRKGVLQDPKQRLGLAQLLIRRNLLLSPEQRDWAEVERILAGFPESGIPSSDIPLLRAEVAAAKGQWEIARRYLDEERQRRPLDVAPWLALAGLAARQGGSKAAEPILEDAEKKLGKRSELFVARIRLAAGGDREEAMRTLGRIETDIDAFTEEEQNRLRQGLAEIYDRLGNIQASSRLWRRLADQQANNLTARVRLLELAIQGADSGGAQRLLGQIRSIEGERGPLSSYGEAGLLLVLAAKGQREQLLEAREHAAHTTAQRPTWADAVVLQARIEDALGDRQQALQKYRGALELGTRQPDVLRRVVDLLYLSRRFHEAQDILGRYPDQASASIDLGRREAELMLLAGGPTAEPDRKLQALAKAQQAIGPDSKNYRDLLWLGQVALAADQHAEAEKSFRRSLALASKAPEPWGALALLMARTEPKKAESLLKEAERKLPPDVGPVVLAAGYEALGRMKEAKRYHEALLAAKPADPMVLQNAANFYTRAGQSEMATVYLRRLLDPQTRAPDATRDWARRTLAISLARTGDYAKFREATTLLDGQSQDGPATVEEDHARALVFASRPETRRQAVELLERSLRVQSLTAEDRFLLARLFEALGNWSAARQHFLTAIQSENFKSPPRLAYYGAGLLKHGDLQGAAFCVQKLEDLEPNSWPTVAIKARLLHQKGKTESAVQLLQKFGKTHAGYLAYVGASLEQEGRLPEAEKAYRQWAVQPQRPAAVLSLAQFLGRQKRTAEALEICQGAWASCRPEAVAVASLNILRAGQPTPDQCQNLADRMAAAAKNGTASTTLLELQAELEDLRTAYDQAIPLYRRVFEQNDKDVVSRNNLGWLLAMRENRGEEALELLNQAIEIAGPNAELLDTRAVAYMVSRQYESAVHDLEEAIRITPKADHYFHLARAHHLAGNRTAAATALRKSRDLGLTLAAIHPFEQAAYRELISELE